jgi:hypothetical protein
MVLCNSNGGDLLQSTDLRTTYSCHLEIPAREDAMFQVLVEGVGRMYPSIEGANLSIRHELLGPEEAHHDAASGWMSSVQFLVFVFLSCVPACETG